MPNWCENRLTIQGDKAVLDEIEVKHFRDTTDGAELDFNTIIPYPQECKDADARESKEMGFASVFSEEGYNWCCNNWGTKWNAKSTSSLRVDDNELEVTFDTAWSPPIPVVLAFSTLYPQLVFELQYVEYGCGFGGYSVCKNGQEIEVDHYDVEMEEEDDE